MSTQITAQPADAMTNILPAAEIDQACQLGEYIRPFDEGRHDCWLGFGASENPHHRGTTDALEWERGYTLQARLEPEQTE